MYVDYKFKTFLYLVAPEITSHNENHFLLWSFNKAMCGKLWLNCQKGLDSQLSNYVIARRFEVMVIGSKE